MKCKLVLSKSGIKTVTDQEVILLVLDCLIEIIENYCKMILIFLDTTHYISQFFQNIIRLGGRSITDRYGVKMCFMWTTYCVDGVSSQVCRCIEVSECGG